MHRQREGPGAVVISILEALAVVGLVPEYRQGMLGRWIVDHAGDVLLFQMGNDLIPGFRILRQYRVLGPGGNATVRHKGRLQLSDKRIVIPTHHSLTLIDLIVAQGLQLGQQHGCLNGIQTGVHAHPDVVVLAAGPLAVDAEGADQVRHAVIVCKDGTAVTIAAQGLGREEGGGGDMAEGAGLFPVVGGAEALGRVLDEEEAYFSQRAPIAS